MRVLLVYASRFGATKGIADRIADVLRDHGLEVTIEAAASAKTSGEYDAYVIGSAVNAGHWLKDATAFTRRYGSILATRPVWLFSSGPITDAAVRAAQPDPAEVTHLRREITPRDHRVFAGAFDRRSVDPNSLGLVERTIVLRFIPEGDWRDWHAIEAWAHGIARELTPVGVS